ncbi:MAG: ABC transporter ATP-binding protein [Bacteroidales bacterium]|nr:ABC transporter ATP-binding protein [Bacteroidales bacterium]
MTNILSIKNIVSGYGDKTIIKNISFEVGTGSLTGIIGPNACGKTTLFRTITGDISLNSGEIFIAQKDISKLTLKEKAKKIAIVTQSFDLPNLSVEEYVLLGRYPYNNRFQFFESNKDYEVAHKYMKLTDTYRYKDQQINKLSGGAQQLVAIARALTQEPDLLLLDEPTSHLDITHQVQVLNLIRRLNKEMKLSVLMIIHDLNLAGEYCENLVLMNAGKVHIMGTAEEVLNYKDIEEVYKTIVITQKNPISNKPAVFLVSDEGNTI